MKRNQTSQYLQHAHLAHISSGLPIMPAPSTSHSSTGKNRNRFGYQSMIQRQSGFAQITPNKQKYINPDPFEIEAKKIFSRPYERPDTCSHLTAHTNEIASNTEMFEFSNKGLGARGSQARDESLMNSQKYIVMSD